jgi:hypothetical protein
MIMLCKNYIFLTYNIHKEDNAYQKLSISIYLLNIYYKKMIYILNKLYYNTIIIQLYNGVF